MTFLNGHGLATLLAQLKNYLAPKEAVEQLKNDTALATQVDYSVLSFDTSEQINGSNSTDYENLEIDYSLIEFDTSEIIDAVNNYLESIEINYSLIEFDTSEIVMGVV